MIRPACARRVLVWLVLCVGPLRAQEATAAFAAAEAQFANQAYEAAATAFAAFVARFPTHSSAPQAAFRVAQCHGRLGQPERAAEACGECWEKYKTSRFGDTALYNKGYYLFTAKQWQRAAAAFFDYTKVGREPGYKALAWYWRGEALFNLTRYADAVGAYQSFLAQPTEVLAAENVAPQVPWAWYSIAVSRQAEGKHAEALAALDALLAKFAGHAQVAEARWRRGLCFQAQKRDAEALAAFGEVLEQHRDSPFAPRALFGMIEIEQARGNAARAEGLKNRLAAEYPASAELLSGARFALAKERFDAGDLAAAERLYREALQGAVGETEAIGLTGLAETLYRAKDWAGAEIVLQQLLARHGEHATADHARVRLADCLLMQDKHAAAEQGYRACLERGVVEREFGRVKYNLALAVRGQGRDEEALKLFWEAAEADPKAELAAGAWMVIAGQTGDSAPAEAARACRLLLEHQPRHAQAAQARFTLGRALAAQKLWTEAAAAWRELVDKHPADPLAEAGLVQLVGAYRELGDTERARAAAAELQQRFPASEQAGDLLFAEGMAQFGESQFDAAAATFERFVAQHPGHASVPAALANLGASHFRAGGETHLRQSAAAYQRLAEQHGTSSEAAGALFWAGRALQQAGDHGAAAELLRRFVDGRPEASFELRARSRLAESLRQLRRFGEAVEVLRAGLRPDLPAEQAAGVRLELARALMQDGQTEAGLAELDRIATEAPQSDAAAQARLELAGRRFDSGDPIAAADAYRAWLADFPDHARAPHAVWFLATALAAAGRHGEAAATFARAAELLPEGSTDRASVMLGGADALLAADQLAEAEAVLDAFDRAFPSGAPRAGGLRLRGLLAFRREQYATAERLLREVLERHPESPEAPPARLALGRVLQAQQQFEAARAVYLPLAERTDGEPALVAEARLRLGECYFSADLIEEALDAFLRADGLNVPAVALPARYWAGRCYQRKGDRERAREKYQRVINDQPESDWARRAKQALDELAG